MDLSPAERRVINAYQRRFPLDPRPFRTMGEALGMTEEAVLECVRGLKAKGVLSRVGAVVAPNRAGVSTLVAMEVPAERLEAIARLVSERPEVNHNYEREHALNLWFVVTAADRERLDAVLASIEADTGLAVLDLPLERPYHIDLGFPV